MEQLERDDNYAELHDPKVPFCFMWLYNRFLELYNYSGESITWTSIESYGNMRNIKFSQFELDYILRMSSWANGKISEMREQES